MEEKKLGKLDKTDKQYSHTTMQEYLSLGSWGLFLVFSVWSPPLIYTFIAIRSKASLIQ